MDFKQNFKIILKPLTQHDSTRKCLNRTGHMKKNRIAQP